MNMLLLAIICLIGFILVCSYRRRRSHPAILPDFATLTGLPNPNPLRDFNMANANSRPYRPLRWPYHQTMALHRLDSDYWLELESSYVERISQRKALYKEHGKLILDALPGSEDACKELMLMSIHFLCLRYPSQFHLEGALFHNRILGISSDILSVEPLLFLLDHVPEDFAVILRDPKTGLHTFSAGVICSAVGWSLGSKLGQTLDDIHLEVPSYGSKLKPSLERFFTKLPCSKPIQRGSWSLEIGPQLFLQEFHPHYALRQTQSPTLTASEVCFRVDWQTLRRLPQTQAIVFNFKALFTPLDQLRNEPYVPALLHKILSEGDKEVLDYKSVGHVCHVVVPKLKEWDEEQRGLGLVEKGWEVRTLAEEPFFPDVGS